MKQPTLKQFKHWSAAHSALAKSVVMAQAFAQCKRAQVDAYIAPVFELFDFYPSETNLAHGLKRERITNINRLYLTDLDSDEYKKFLAECDKENRAHGFTGPIGHCPALIAEELQRIAERALLESMSPLFDVEFGDTYGENRVNALDLALGACLKKAA